MGYYVSRARTGIARVIESLATALGQRTDINLYFSAYESLDAHIRTRKYLEQQSALRLDCLATPQSKLGRTLIDSYERLGLTAPAVLKSHNLLAKFNRKLQKSLQLNTLLSEGIMGLAGVQRVDIFHTPFFPFPKFTNQVQRLSRFLTVYDLIPVLLPEYFTFNERRNLKTVIKRITGDDFVLAISQSTKNDLCDYAKINPSRVFVTHLAASEQFQPCTNVHLIQHVCSTHGVPDAPYVLSLCTLEPRKNIDQTIRSFCRLVKQEKIENLNLVLVGASGWKFKRIFEQIDQAASLRDRIFITGYVPDEDLSPLYSGALMFVYPSFYEGFGLPPLEAMQCGVPVITSNTSSLPEVVGDAGIMIDPNDSDALCQAMNDLYTSIELRSALSEKGLNRAAQFSWQKCADETVKAYYLSR